jgi:hypothetical protein
MATELAPVATAPKKPPAPPARDVPPMAVAPELVARLLRPIAVPPMIVPVTIVCC